MLISNICIVISSAGNILNNQNTDIYAVVSRIFLLKSTFMWWKNDYYLLSSNSNNNIYFFSRCNSSVLCSQFASPTSLYAGTFNKEVVHMDLRSNNIVSSICYHKGCVLRMTANENSVLTTSEDGTLKVFDLRYNEVVETLKVNS